MADKQIGAENSSVVLQANASSTVAGAEVEINQAGKYRFYAEGTIDATRPPTLYVKPRGASAAKAYKDVISGAVAQVTVDGGACEVVLCGQDTVYSQNTVSGGTYNYNAILGRIE